MARALNQDAKSACRGCFGSHIGDCVDATVWRIVWTAVCSSGSAAEYWGYGVPACSAPQSAAVVPVSPSRWVAAYPLHASPDSVRLDTCMASMHMYGVHA